MGGGLTPSSLPQSLALTAAFVSSINIAGWFFIVQKYNSQIRFNYFFFLFVCLKLYECVVCVLRWLLDHPEDVGHV